MIKWLLLVNESGFTMKRVIFIGCEQFGSRGFEYIANSEKLKQHFEIVGVITQFTPAAPDRLLKISPSAWDFRYLTAK
jgi:methionyl-tRNA formyltransferase